MMMEQRTLFIFLKSFGFFDFLFLIGFILPLILMVFFVFKSFIKRQETAGLMKKEVLPELISKFGKVVSIETANFDRAIRFERNGTIFDVKVSKVITELISQTQVIVQFNLPNLQEKFYIHHKYFYSSETFKECQLVQLTMPDDFIFLSFNPQFLTNLVSKDNIRNEIYKYQKKYCNQFSIAFENGLFTITWSPIRYEHESPHDEAQKLEQLCQTAVVFYDEVTKK